MYLTAHNRRKSSSRRKHSTTLADGVVIFSPFTGASTVAAYDEQLDTCAGHPANSVYHYHGYSPCLHGEVFADATTHSKIYGWAFDGFPIYGPFGYTNATDTTSAITRITGSYECTDSGTTCTTNAQKAVTATANWAYSSCAGHLDDCNGRYGVGAGARAPTTCHEWFL